MSAPPDPRIDAILEVLLAFSRQDFAHKAPVSDRLDAVDALASGLNMLAEELDGAVASRNDLEAAYRELQQAQARLVHSGKLVAIGQLASGVAHEINNPAGWVLISLGLLTHQLAALRALTADPALDAHGLRERMRRVLADAEHALADASDGMGRIHAVAADLRTFSRPDGADDDEHVWLDAVVQAACNLAQPLLRNTVALELDLCGKAGVNGNRGRLGQVVTNLVVNAAQAVASPAARGNQVRIETRAFGEQVMLAVEDAGPGIPEANRARVFEPFFTTKSAEQGTGLGLSLVAEIVQRSGGTVSVSSGRLGGARFEVLLPAAVAPARVEPAEPELPAATRRGRVLIIDDEPRLLQTYGLVLGADHEVCLVGSGAEAIALLERDRRFDFVLCDLQMPGVSGVEVYERLVAIGPELVPRLVFSTGGVFQPRVKEFLERTRVEVLEKPVRVETVLARIDRALELG